MPTWIAYIGTYMYGGVIMVRTLSRIRFNKNGVIDKKQILLCKEIYYTNV